MQPDVTDLATYEAALDAMVERVRADTERVLDLRSTLDQLEITGYAERGAVTVRLLGSGRFTAIDIQPEVLRGGDPDAVGQVVLAAVNDGLRRLHERSRTMFAPVIADAGPGA